jgi:hypothetical protein
MRQIFTLTGHTLSEHFRSWQFLAELLPPAAIIALFFKYVSQSGNYDQFAATIGAYLILQSVLTTALIFAQANHARSYTVLAHLASRWPFFVAKLLASILLVFASYVLLLAYLLPTRLLSFAPGENAWFDLLLGSGAMLLNVVTICAITALVMPLVSGSTLRLLILTLLALSVFSYSVADIPQPLRFLAAPFNALTFPFLFTYQLAHHPEFQPWTPLALATNLLYLVLALLLARFFFSRRELLLALLPPPPLPQPELCAVGKMATHIVTNRASHIARLYSDIATIVVA